MFLLDTIDETDVGGMFILDTDDEADVGTVFLLDTDDEAYVGDVFLLEDPEDFLQEFLGLLYKLGNSSPSNILANLPRCLRNFFLKVGSSDNRVNFGMARFDLSFL